jgi:hypothetical protein
VQTRSLHTNLGVVAESDGLFDVGCIVSTVKPWMCDINSGSAVNLMVSPPVCLK